MRSFAQAAAVLCASLAVATAQDSATGVQAIPYDSVSHPNLDDAHVMDELMKEFDAANARTPPSSVMQTCPSTCSEVGSNSKDWNLYADVTKLAKCDKTMLLDFAVDRNIDDKSSEAAIRACVADLDSNTKKAKRAKNIGTCALAKSVKTKAKLQIGSKGAAGPSDASKNVAAAGRQIQRYLKSNPAECKDAISFASSHSALVGFYAGSQIQTQGITADVLDKFLAYVEKNGVSDATIVQLCDAKNRGSDFAVGIVASASGDISYVQDAVKAWNNGECAPEVSNLHDWNDITMQVPATIASSNSTLTGRSFFRRGIPSGNSDGTCKTQKVIGGDSCASMASKCGISGDDFTKLHPGADFCSKLVPGQHVCCTKGKLPDFSPKPGADGVCATHTVGTGDSCSALAAENSLTNEQIEAFNKHTWGWNGCKVLWKGVNICLSKGEPPMPAPVANAVCGPTVPGTKKPKAGTNLTELNPCPLKVCCNIWGQCGVNEDFCTITKSETGAPGTAKAGTNGCVQNCGMNIIRSDPRADAIRIAYFGAWNWDRECLNMHVDETDTNKYTHIHFAFADLTPQFTVDVSKVQDEFDRFKKVTGVKKIISFGGWDFSTSASTYHILRDAVKAENRGKFQSSVIDFVTKHKLDGFDLDWEYPSAPDIPGIPSGDPEDGKNYYKFLYNLRGAMDKSKSISFAAPASYWYLKAFPVEMMYKVLDYMVYMTYDLHGQWDAGNKWTSPGCEEGNCLRSHVNLTETLGALSMITKAGVPSNKVVVGVSSYGRSFKMAQAGCDGPACHFTGTKSVSYAKKGMCTKTSGYISDAEIKDIIDTNPTAKTWKDKSSSNILVYDNTEWVSYMDDGTKSSREKLYSNYHFAGTSDWSVDLQAFESERDAGDYEPPPKLEKCDQEYDSVEAVEAANPPWNCVDQYIMGALEKELDAALQHYNDIINDGYDHKYNTFAKAVKQSYAEELKQIYFDDTDEYYNCFQARADGKKDNGQIKYKNASIACPPKNQIDQAFNIYLVPKDEDKLYKHIEDKYGITKDAIRPQHLRLTPCLKEQEKISPCDEWGSLIGAPELDPNWNMPNPKDAVSKSLDKMDDLKRFLSDAELEMYLGVFVESTKDAVDATGMPAYMVVAAVDAMEQIKEAGEEIEKKERENIILLALTAIFFVIPGLGEAVGAITGIAAVARIATIIAEVGGAGLGVYDIATNPKNAPLEIFGIIMGGVAIRGAARGWLKDAAKIRRGMKADDIANMGKTVEKGMERINGLVKVCRKL